MQTLTETTNGRTMRVCEDIRLLIDWAEADAQHARENDAPDTAKDDSLRAKRLKKALALIEDCFR